MIRIPNIEKRFSQPNNSDLFGNIYYTKNINFDEEGYIKLSPRALSLVNSADDDDYSIPFAFAREQSEKFTILTPADVYEVDVSEGNSDGLSGAIDDGADRPSVAFDSRGRFWRNAFHITTNTGLESKNINGDWTDRSHTLTSGFIHALEVFRNRNTLCVSDGNEVDQLDVSYSAGTKLVLPTDFEVVDMAYNAGLMGIITKLSDTSAAQNQQAFFFIWDGATASANKGVPVGSDMCVAIAAYGGSWIVLTRTGQVLFYTGSGFQTLLSLPHYYLDATWGDSRNLEALGDLMQVEGDVIYFNLNNRMERYGTKGEEYIPNAPGGILCYDPKVGLYHRYAPSISEISRLTVTSANINTETDTFTKTAGTIPPTGNPVKYIYDSATVIGGLTISTVYYIIKVSSTEFKLATTKENAINGTAINITGTGATTNYLMAADLKDYGQNRISRTGAIGLLEKTVRTARHMLFGGELYPSTSGENDVEHLNILVEGFKNKGYVVTPKIPSNQAQDSHQSITIKYVPLKEGEKIIVKVKDRDKQGIPVSTPQSGQHCTWMAPNTFKTSADLSEAKELFDLTQEMEAEIISGAGGGNLEQIESIAEDDGVYSVVLKEDVEGVTAGDECDVLIENYEIVGTITSDYDEGEKTYTVDKISPSMKYKIILEGVDIRIEEILIDNGTHKPAE